MTEAVGLSIAICATVAILSFISHTGADKGGERLVFGAIFLFATVTGACELFTNITPTAPDTAPGTAYKNQAEEVARDAFCRGIVRLISLEYSLPEGCVSVRAEGFSLSTVSAERVVITLSERGLTVDRAAVLHLLSDSGIKNCEVSYSYDTST